MAKEKQNRETDEQEYPKSKSFLGRVMERSGRKVVWLGTILAGAAIGTGFVMAGRAKTEAEKISGEESSEEATEEAEEKSEETEEE